MRDHSCSAQRNPRRPSRRLATRRRRTAHRALRSGRHDLLGQCGVAQHRTEQRRAAWSRLADRSRGRRNTISARRAAVSGRRSTAARRCLPVTDKYFGGSIGALAVSESNPDIVYIGGGETQIRGNVSVRRRRLEDDRRRQDVDVDGAARNAVHLARAHRPDESGHRVRRRVRTCVRSEF